jgi:hypothetical protein
MKNPYKIYIITDLTWPDLTWSDPTRAALSGIMWLQLWMKFIHNWITTVSSPLNSLLPKRSYTYDPSHFWVVGLRSVLFFSRCKSPFMDIKCYQNHHHHSWFCRLIQHSTHPFHNFPRVLNTCRVQGFACPIVQP